MNTLRDKVIDGAIKMGFDPEGDKTFDEFMKETTDKLKITTPKNSPQKGSKKNTNKRGSKLTENTNIKELNTRNAEMKRNLLEIKNINSLNHALEKYHKIHDRSERIEKLSNYSKQSDAYSRARFKKNSVEKVKEQMAEIGEPNASPFVVEDAFRKYKTGKDGLLITNNFTIYDGKNFPKIVNKNKKDGLVDVTTKSYKIADELHESPFIKDLRSVKGNEQRTMDKLPIEGNKTKHRFNQDNIMTLYKRQYY